ncbi:MAG: 50S ribosomal protein L14e [Nanoarchaeota archaeon]|nr:50S ribosomal protein L14e [Nanoarchaeota archaeon]
MSIFEVGRICLKIAGRDAGRKCVVIDQFDNHYVLVDGATRRKKVNIKHLEPLAELIKIKVKASSDDVRAAFQKLGLDVWDTKAKKETERQKKHKKQKQAAGSTTKKGKKVAKKEEAMVPEDTEAAKK